MTPPQKRITLQMVVLSMLWALSVNGLLAAEKPSAEPKGVRAGPALREGVPYETVIEPTTQSAVNNGLRASSQLLLFQKMHDVGPYALAGRIHGDYDRLIGVLRSEGYYAGQVRITVEGLVSRLDGMEPLLASHLAESRPQQKITLHISAVLGPIFHIGHIFFIPQSDDTARDDDHVPHEKGKNEREDKKPSPFVLSQEEQRVLGLKEGDKAVARDVLAAKRRLLSYMKEEGYAFASLSTPQAILQRDKQQVDIRFYALHGPKVTIGPIRLQGLRYVKEDYLRQRLSLKEGQLYQPSAIEAARMDVDNRGLFSSVQVRRQFPLQSLPQDMTFPARATEVMPLSFDFVEGKRHNISGDVGYSTDLGGRAGVSWLHRNLLGRGESLRLSAMATGLGGTVQQGLGYDVFADFHKPDFMQRDRVLDFHSETVRQLLYSYHQTAWFLQGGLFQPLSKEWSVFGGGAIEKEEIRQFGVTRDYFIVSLPLQANYDSTHRSNPIEPATYGVRVNLGVTPAESVYHGSTFFVLMSAQSAAYFDLTHLAISKPGQSIIALRGMVGSIQGASIWQIPPDQRFYVGGLATVRGFRYQGVGPQYGKYAIGGTSMDTGTVELRQHVYHNIGIALFSDAGQVGNGSIPGHGKLNVGYGGGVRYFTPVGPVRVDVSFPVKRPDHGDKWEIYIGLGETF